MKKQVLTHALRNILHSPFRSSVKNENKKFLRKVTDRYISGHYVFNNYCGIYSSFFGSITNAVLQRERRNILAYNLLVG
jgi:hypothetical protein